MTAQLYAGDRLEHPAIQRTLDADGAIRFLITGALDRDAATVLGKLIRIDLLAARGAVRGEHRTCFILDCADCPDMHPQALALLKDTTRLVQQEMGYVIFEGVSDDLHEHLITTKFANIFTIRRADGQAKPALKTVPT